MTNEPCPFCGGTLTQHQHIRYHWETAAYGAVCHTVALEHMECALCGSHITTPDQSRSNKKAIIAVKLAYPTVFLA